MKRFRIDPDVAAARTIDKDFYLDEAVFAAVREKVFARSWQWLGPPAAVAAPGSLAPCEVAGEPLLLVHDGAGSLRCLSNVCTHRGMPLVAAPCQADHIRCPYHGRRFDLAGHAKAMPGFEGVADFPAPEDHLPEVPSATWRGHAFASLAPAAPLTGFMADVDARLPPLAVEGFRHDPARSRAFEFDAHWALYVENYLEGLHIPFLHPGLTQTLELSDYAYALGRFANLQLGIAREGEPAFAPPPGHPDHGLRVAAYYWWVFPNLMLNFYPWGLSINRVEPLSPTRTRVVFEGFVADATLLGRGAGGALDPVEMEDEAAVVAVQRGIRSRFYRTGRYSPRHERGVHQFHRLLAEFLES